MKVVFDGYWWGDGPAAVRQIMRAIVLTWRDELDDELVVVVRHRDLAAARAELGPTVDVRGSRLYPQALLAALPAAWIGRRVRADAVVTHNFAAVGRRSFVFVHDFMFMTSPQWFTRVERAYFALMPLLARAFARTVLATSSAEAARIRRFVGRRTVVPVGIGRSDALTGASPEPVAGLAPRGFWLAVGRINARKNLGMAIEAALESGVVDASNPLVLVGEADGAPVRLSDRAEQAVAAGAVVFQGHVSDGQLRWLFENARASLYLSVDEGFGMPPLESLSLGTPVIASNIAVMVENLPAGTTMVDPLDLTAIARAIRDEDARELDAGRSAQLRSSVTQPEWADVVHAIRSVIVSSGGGAA